MARTCEGSRSSSTRLNASARSGAGALSTTITLPLGLATRFISFRTARGSRKWWNAKREVTIENDASGNGSGSTSPCFQVTLVSPCAAWFFRACSSMAGVRSIPVAWRTVFAKAQTTRPPPQATSRTVSSGPASLNSTMRRSAASSLMADAVLNGTACRVNWSRIESLCVLIGLPRLSQGLLHGPAALHDDLQVVLILEHPQVPQRIAGDDDQIGVLPRLDGADAIRHAEQRGVDPGGREQHLHRLHHLGLQLELDRALHHHVAQEIGARADLTAGPVRICETLYGLLARQVDLLDLVIADAVALALAIDHLVGDHRGDQERPGLFDGSGGGLADQVAVLDRAHARLDGVADRGVRVGVGQDVLADCARLLDRRAHLGDRELRGVELVRRRHGAAGGHDLDLVDVAAQLLAHRLAHLGLAVGDRADHADAAVDRLDPLGTPPLVAVAAGLGDVAAGDEHARAGIDPLVDGLAEAVVGAAGIAHSREALQEAFFGAPERLGRQEARRKIAMLIGDVALDGADVHVRIGEPGHERRALAVERRHRSGQRANTAARHDLLDPVVLDDDGGALDRVGAGAIDEDRVGEDGQAHRSVTFASYIQTFSSARGVQSP